MDASLLLPLGFGLLSALTWGAGDFGGGMASRRAHAQAVVLWASGIGLLLFLLLAQVFGEAPQGRDLPYALLGGASGALGLLAFYRALAQGEMGLAAPVAGVVGAALPVALGALLEGWPGLFPALGMGLGLLAVWLVSRPEGRARPGNLGLALLAPVLLVGSLNLNDIVNWQKEHGWLFLYAFPAFLVYLIASMAEAARTPFDLPEAEQELVGGYHTEYSSIKWALFQMAEYIHFITASALIPTLFLGGWTMPVLEVPYLWMFLKIAFFLFFFIWIRATWFRLRYGWGFLFPLALLWFLVTALVVALDLPRTYLLYLSALSFLVLLGAVLYTPKPARKGGGA